MTNNRSAGDHAPHATTAEPDRAGKPAGGPAQEPAAKSAAARDGAAKTGTANTAKQPTGTGASRGSRARRRAASQPVAQARRGVSIVPGGSVDQVDARHSDAPERVVRVGSPASLLALVPQLMGFEPRDSIVVVGFVPPRGRVRLTLRFDLRGTSDPGVADVIARRLLSVLAAQELKAGVAVGYGPGRLVTPVADALRRHATQAGFRLAELLRAQDGRYWSYLCTEPACCPAGGVPYDVAGHPVTAAFAAAGAPPVLADRAELVASVAALAGAAGESMREATRLAQDRVDRLITEMMATGRKGAARRLIATVGLEAVSEAITRYQQGGEFASDGDAAWLSIMLSDLRVRDDAWSRMEPAHGEAHLRLWTDLTRRATPGHVAPAASLLAFVAWQCGNGALANVALDRALADNPEYSMAQLLREAIDAGAPPRLARLPMTPQEVAASYADAYGDPSDDDPSDEDPSDEDPEEAAEDAPEFGDADFGDPGDDGCGVSDTDEEEIARQG